MAHNLQFLVYPVGIFSYGMYRQWHCKENPPFNLIGHRVLFSVGNGFLYISPFGIFKLFNLVNRLDIAYNKRDKTQYTSPYVEMFGENYNTI